ncbi:MAG TPA: hemolysin family protein [Actinomycetes bacterium]|nr:hemolysin family protein [Actinomycetes bacterium]
MSSTWLSIGVVLVFILIGGFFAAAEIALISLRDSQVNAMAGRGSRGRRVKTLHDHPNRFLSAVQVGVTLAGFLSAAFGASTLADDVSPVLEDWGMTTAVADVTALVGITLVIAYFSLVLGELAPKRLALQRAEGLSLVVAPIIDALATISRPLIWLLSRSTDLVVRLAGGDPAASREAMTEEELRHLVAGHAELDDEERLILDEVFTANDRALREIMVPRTEVDFLDASTPVFKAIKDVATMPHSRYPVIRGSADDVAGFVHVRDLYDPSLSGRSVRVGEIAREVMMLPWTNRVLAALSEMRAKGQHLAIVVDEYGGTAGIVAFEDLVEELVGDIRDEYDVDEPETTRLGESVEVDGLLNIEDFADETGVELPEGPYETAAGFVMNRLGHVPRLGERVAVAGHQLEVVGLDGRRASRIRVTPVVPDLA